MRISIKDCRHSAERHLYRPAQLPDGALNDVLHNAINDAARSLDSAREFLLAKIETILIDYNHSHNPHANQVNIGPPYSHIIPEYSIIDDHVVIRHSKSKGTLLACHIPNRHTLPPDARATAKRQQRRRDYASRGLCVNCGKPKHPSSRSYCQYHLERARKQRGIVKPFEERRAFWKSVPWSSKTNRQIAEASGYSRAMVRTMRAIHAPHTTTQGRKKSPSGKEV